MSSISASWGLGEERSIGAWFSIVFALCTSLLRCSCRYTGFPCFILLWLVRFYDAMAHTFAFSYLFFCTFLFFLALDEYPRHSEISTHDAGREINARLLLVAFFNASNFVYFAPP